MLTIGSDNRSAYSMQYMFIQIKYNLHLPVFLMSDYLIFLLTS